MKAIWCLRIFATVRKVQGHESRKIIQGSEHSELRNDGMIMRIIQQTAEEYVIKISRKRKEEEHEME